MPCIYCLTCTLRKKIYVGETGRRFVYRFRLHFRDVEKNDIAASKPVARHFKPSYSIPLQHDNLRAILTPREHRKISNKNSSSNWVYTIHMRSMNASHSTNLSTNSYDHISTNGKALPHSYINLQHPTIPLFALTKY